MARCDEGYRCEVCGRDVEHILDSDLYLRFVIGELDPERLHNSSERHLRCNPTLSQFIEHPQFEALQAPGPFDKRNLDAQFVADRQDLVSRGYERLQRIAAGELGEDLTAYPLPEVAQRYR